MTALPAGYDTGYWGEISPERPLTPDEYAEVIEALAAADIWAPDSRWIIAPDDTDDQPGTISTRDGDSLRGEDVGAFFEAVLPVYRRLGVKLLGAIGAQGDDCSDQHAYIVSDGNDPAEHGWVLVVHVAKVTFEEEYRYEPSDDPPGWASVEV